MVRAQKYILQKRSRGFPKPTDFKLEREELPPLQEHEYLAEAVYLSVDPYMRAYMPKIPLNTVMLGGQVAKITESRSPKYPRGKYVVGNFGWRTHTILRDDVTEHSGIPVVLLPDLGDLPVSLSLGMLGMPGNTAYFGFLELCDPKPGETVVVSGAAGAVGSHVGQIAKIKGCKVIGIAGTDKKGKWLTKGLGFDSFINYKTQNVKEELLRQAPDGVDCYFDNVGGDITSIVLNQMNRYGRISVCGAISGYNDEGVPKAPAIQNAIIVNQLKMEGFMVQRWSHRWMEGITQNLEWIRQGKLKYQETVTNGFNNMFNGFTDMLKGVNTGKAVVKV
ncbi:prostaglandin reductase 1-like [Anthonomus grandis grandis]|uniref:prostaglandin reductase 1-like n=1 Tax=Anthonomus grandis grandis TaxID=2921223 RepID=UPI00216624B2|nr:prostaglandin reductase 1-like [Anthonomus grandis grandis]